MKDAQWKALAKIRKVNIEINLEHEGWEIGG